MAFRMFPKILDKFILAIQRLVLIHPHKLEIQCIQDFTTLKENASAEDIPSFKEKNEVGHDAIALEKPGSEDSDATKRDHVEKVEKEEGVTPEETTTKVANDTTPKKVSADVAAMETQEVSSGKAEMVAQENSTEMTADSTPEEEPQEKASWQSIRTSSWSSLKPSKKVDLNLST